MVLTIPFLNFAPTHGDIVGAIHESPIHIFRTDRKGAIRESPLHRTGIHFFFPTIIT